MGNTNFKIYLHDVCQGIHHVYELSVAQLVRFLVVEPAHHGSSPRLGIFFEFIPGFNLISAILSVVGGVLVDSSLCPFVKKKLCMVEAMGAQIFILNAAQTKVSINTYKTL